MKKLFLSAAFLSVLFMASCGNKGNKADLSGEWNITSIEGQNITGKSNAFIGFDTKEGKIYGNAGCNNIMGGLNIDSINPGHIILSNIASTRMMCPDMDTEMKLLAALKNVAGFQSSANGIELTDKSGKVILSLKKKDDKQVTSASISSLEGEWIISKVNGNDVKAIEKTPFLAFNITEKSVHGNAGCNIINGSIEQEGNKDSSLKFGQMMSTMMAGPGMEAEGDILAAIGKVSSFVFNADGSVSLNDTEGNEVILLTKNNGKSLIEK